MTQLFANNASGTNSVTLEVGHTALVLQTGEGNLFPTPTGSDFFYATVEDVSGNLEIVKCTGKSDTDILTVVRGQESTTEREFVTGSRVELRVTAATFNNFLQLSGGTMSGELNVNDQVLRDPLITNGEARNLTLRGIDGGTSNQLIVPSAGAAPTIGGSQIYTAANLSVSTAYVPDTQAATTTNPIAISGGVVSIDAESLTTIEGRQLAATDTFYVEDAGVSKGIEVQKMGLRITSQSGAHGNLAPADMNSIMEFTGTSGITLPHSDTVSLPIGVPIVLHVRHASQYLTATAAAGVTLVSVWHPAGAVGAADNVKPGGTALLYKSALNIWALSGDILT